MGTWSNLKAGLRPEGRNDLCRMWAVSQASSEVLRDCGVRLTDVAGHNVTTGGGGCSRGTSIRLGAMW